MNNLIFLLLLLLASLIVVELGRRLQIIVQIHESTVRSPLLLFVLIVVLVDVLSALSAALTDIVELDSKNVSLKPYFFLRFSPKIGRNP